MKFLKGNSLIPRLAIVLAVVCVTYTGSRTIAADLEGYTEPYRNVAVASPEIGVIESLAVEEGDHVGKGQLLIQMEDSVLRASMAVARAAMDSTGRVSEAEADLQAKRDQLDSYKALIERGNATQRELDRAKEAVLVSESRLQSIREEMHVRKLEFQRAEAQWKLRQITSPLDGVVVSIAKRSGEFVAPTDPVILQVAQLDRLSVVFSVPISQADGLADDQTVSLRVGRDLVVTKGTIEYVSPLTDPQSGSRRVRIRIENSDLALSGGVVCRWDLNHAPSTDPSIRRQATRGPVRSLW
ncbi:efflux RND transporter periplasmic adaptor subunit [Stieleria varia]|uniref:Multidrug resistance protein MdtA n=1 Tax=Stieleria varia TaxID=2528005 RepID=A0A5C6BA00_9BACT|nr:efflux RND transporter periplasmic adaptor subunit [Stieleria varia]TWU08261.1 Multidrug resistance protein MdtA precursor [Stieleria varia]